MRLNHVASLIVNANHHIPHADNEREENGHWVPNHTPNRKFTAIAYLNSDFTGGELIFPHRNLTIKPEPGLVVAFPCDHNFVHQVAKVLTGKRYSLPIWFV